MFDDIGGKIKTLAKITRGLGIAASIIGADCALDAEEQQLQPDDNYRRVWCWCWVSLKLHGIGSFFYSWIWSVD
ncbi:MAG: hypothetical protein ACLUN5_19190 [Oscillospiraceae bacterium]